MCSVPQQELEVKEQLEQLLLSLSGQEQVKPVSYCCCEGETGGTEVDRHGCRLLLRLRTTFLHMMPDRLHLQSTQ